jgi:hypothetical protein
MAPREQAHRRNRTGSIAPVRYASQEVPAMATTTTITQVMPADEALHTEAEAFERQRDQLLLRYPGQFVAFYQGRLIASSPDDEALAEQMFERLGDVPFFIGRVERAPSRLDLPSPEDVR